MAHYYSVTDLGTGSPDPYFDAAQVNAINDDDRIVGTEDDTAFLWDGGQLQFFMQQVDPQHALPSLAEDVSQAGLIAGDFGVPNGSHAFVFQGGAVTDLSPTMGAQYSQAFATSDGGGYMAGWAAFGSDPKPYYEYDMHAFRYQQASGTVEDLGTLPNLKQSIGYGVNDSGVVVGRSMKYYDGYGDYETGRPFLSADGSMQEILPIGTLGSARRINNAGQVVGRAAAATGKQQAFLYDSANNQLTPLGTLPGGDSSVARDINDAGDVVGGSQGSPGGGFIWNSTDGMLNLNDRIDGPTDWFLGTAHGINNQGHIVGEGRVNNVNSEYLLTPVPAPGLSHGPRADFLAAMVWILFGVVQDGGGLAITPGGIPIPIDPLGPVGATREQRDALAALVLHRLATLVRDERGRNELQQAALDVLDRATADMKKQM
jgi:probable HAF family extracellular repeat protein